MQIQRSVETPAAPAAVFTYLSDFTTTNEWDPGTVRTTLLSGDGGAGTKYHNVSKFAGRETELTYESVAQERPSRLQFRGTNRTATATDTLTLTPSGDGTSTQVHYRADFEFSFPASLVAPLLVKPTLAGIADETVDQMKRVLQNLP